VKPDHTAENRPITVARTFHDETVIAAGLEPGETIVTDGQFRIGPGAALAIKSAAPSPPVNPP
jgi:multidrug efflux system membrane fusion protein